MTATDKRIAEEWRKGYDKQLDSGYVTQRDRRVLRELESRHQSALNDAQRDWIARVRKALDK